MYKIDLKYVPLLEDEENMVIFMKIWLDKPDKDGDNFCTSSYIGLGENLLKGISKKKIDSLLYQINTSLQLCIENIEKNKINKIILENIQKNIN